jgi:hypothetical protein
MKQYASIRINKTTYDRFFEVFGKSMRHGDITHYCSTWIERGLKEHAKKTKEEIWRD